MTKSVKAKPSSEKMNPMGRYSHLSQVFFCLLLALICSACGRGKVTVSNDSYEPRIVIEAILRPNHPVDRVLLTRNFRLDEPLRGVDLLLREAQVSLTDEASGEKFALRFNPDNGFYQYLDNDLSIRFGATYTLEVAARIEDSDLRAQATTTVPEAGFSIHSINHQSLVYRQRDADDKVMNFVLDIDRAPGTTFYLYTVQPLESNNSNFIYDNPFDDKDADDVDEDLIDLSYEYDWIQNTPLDAGRSTIEMLWFYLWFYSPYEIIVWGVDANYANFLQTFDDVQEEDGNFHEPAFAIEGDGIGVFGSAVTDTVQVEVLRP